MAFSADGASIIPEAVPGSIDALTASINSILGYEVEQAAYIASVSGQSYADPSRPTDWLDMPVIQAGDQKFAGLLAVTDTATNYIAISASGNYTINWGDGSVSENISSGTVAEHNYTYSALSDLTTSALGYKQTLIIIVPQSGSSLTNVDLQKKHSLAASGASAYWLDIISSFSRTAGSGIGLTIVNAANEVELPWLSRVILPSGGSFTVGAAAVAASLSISDIVVSSLTQTSLYVAWATDKGATAQVEYGATDSYGSTSTLLSTYTTNRNIFIQGLTASTTYHFRVKSVSAEGVTTYSADDTFTTTAYTAIVLSNVTVSALTNTTVTVGWTTDIPGGSRVQYGTNPTTYGSFTSIDTNLVTAHSQNITGLTAGTLYYFRCISLSSGDEFTGYSTQGTFTTAAAPTLTISNIVLSAGTTTDQTISWDLSTAGNAQIEYGLTNSYGSTTTLQADYATSRSQTITGLTPNTTYHYRIHSVTAGSVSAYSADNTFTTAQQVLVASNITVSATGTTDTVISWGLNIAGNGQIEYGTTTAYGTTSTLEADYLLAHSQHITGLTAGTTYHYRVHSVTAGGLVAYSADATFSTNAAAGLTISGITQSGITTTEIFIGWTLSAAGNGQIEYGLTTAYGSTSTLETDYLTAHTQHIQGLTAATTYHYRIHSVTAAGLSAYSADLTFTTNAAGSTINVTSAPYNALGNGVNDDTAEINAAIQAQISGGTVFFPNGTYMIESVTTGLSMKSGVTLLLDTGATIKCITNSSGHYQMIKFPSNCVGAKIIGSGTRQSTIQGDRITHTDPGNIPVGTNEQGFGIVVQGTNNEIRNVVCRDFWGDGIYIYGTTNGMLVDNIRCYNNRRQGLSITNGTNITIQSSAFDETNGTAPQCGIDSEPNSGNGVSYLSILNNTFTHNGNAGISINCNTGTNDHITITGNVFINYVSYCINQDVKATNVVINNNRLNSSTGTLITKHGTALWY